MYRWLLPQRSRSAELPPLPAATAITGFTAQATFNGGTVAPAPLFWTVGSQTATALRVNVSFPVAAFVNEPSGRYTFTAAAINADGVGLEFANGIGYSVR